MAAGGARGALGCAHYNNYRKVSPLKLGAEHVPFPCSLRELVLDRYGEPVGVGAHAHPMDRADLLEYLGNIDNFSLSPWVALSGQTEAIGDPATPSREEISILRWLGKALEIWEKQSPLEGRVAAQVRRLKPLAAAFALTDPSFLQPGAHPLHQLLDSIQTRAIGWQTRLDRVGAILEQQVTKAVDDARRWFDNKSVDMAAICAEFTAAAERDQARAQRMIQRVVEAEAGKVKTAAAKQEAARMINAALQRHPAPEEIGGFLKGPWYTSAQLLLLKFGAESEQWQKMSDTTETLLDSFANMEDADETRRQHIFEVVAQLPKEMRRWLLSLHHDTEAVNEAMGLVEFAHLRILRKQPLELQPIPPIVVDGQSAGDKEEPKPGTMAKWEVGQWFAVETQDDGIVRVQLVLKIEQSQQLLFTNLAGIKVLQLGGSEFNRLFTQGKVKPLHSGATFSLCLAHAVGIDSVEILDALASALEQAQLPMPSEMMVEEASFLFEEPALPPDELTGETPIPDAQEEPEPVEEILDTDYGVVAVEEESDIATPATDRRPDDELADAQPASDSGFLRDQAEEIRTRGGYFSTPSKQLDTPRDCDLDDLSWNLATHKAEDDDISLDTFPTDSEDDALAAAPADSEEAEGFLSAPAKKRESKPVTDPVSNQDPTQENAPDPLSTPDPGQENDTDAGPEAAAAQEQPQRMLNLPMGAWLGFHDGDTPLMARLAVYDQENDYYIFVNRKGVKVRQITRQNLLSLIDTGLVDILETHSNFRDDVTEVRKSLDQ